MKKLLWLAFLAALLIAGGCAKKQVQPAEAITETETEVVEIQPIEPIEEQVVIEEEVVVQPTAREVYEQQYASLPSEHLVQKGECLWWIAEYQQIYNDPFMWPLIYKANRDQINNPDLIYPNQVFRVPRFFSKDEMVASRKKAGAPRPYLPPQDANLPADLRQELGWGL